MAQLKSKQRISRLEKIGYGLGDTASNIIFQTVMMFMAFFYTDIFGISAAAMGTLFLVVRIIDAVTDPMMGAICDRTNTRWGKFKPYLLWLCLPFAVISIVTFTTPDFGYSGKLVYAYTTYALLMIIYTAINIPYCALGGVITGDTQERVSLNSYRFFLATAAGVLVASSTMTLVQKLGQGNDQKGYQLTMAAMASLAVLMFLACFFSTKERVVQASSKSSTFWKDIKVLFANDQWVIVALLNFILLIPLVIRGSAAIYYITWFAGREELVSAFLTTGAVSSMIGASFASPLTKRLSKVHSYMLIQSVIVLFSVGMFFLGSHNIVTIFVLFAVIQFFAQMGSPILWTMMADTVDYGELKTERRITGLIFSGALFSLKLGMALGGAIFGWLLAYFGYQGEASSQIPGTINGIVLLFTIIPAVGHLLLVGLVTRYRLDKKHCDEIRLMLDGRRTMTV
ncbi:glycoside-pentoside-hexuronide (GPH):cation symporter [bacterium]|nr:glycoside-pentoside-hexuronide (GPH):cation symporter [bacterium]